MHPSRERPSAKEAVEGLKVYQLRKENAVIFDEVKRLHEEFSRHQNDVDSMREALNALKSRQEATAPGNLGTDASHHSSLEAFTQEVQSLRQD